MRRLQTPSSAKGLNPHKVHPLPHLAREPATARAVCRLGSGDAAGTAHRDSEPSEPADVSTEGRGTESGVAVFAMLELHLVIAISTGPAQTQNRSEVRASSWKVWRRNLGQAQRM